MASLDGTLAAPGGAFASPKTLEYKGVSFTGFGAAPISAYDSEQSFCTCEQETPTPTIHTESITAAVSHLDVEFSTDVVLSGPALDVANWYVTVDGPGKEVTVGAITQLNATTVRLTVTTQTQDAEYTLHLPQRGITSDEFGVFTGLYSLEFEGVATPVTVQMIRVVDTHHLDVIFAIAVDEDEASDPLNYAINNGLTVVSATKITDFQYRLRNTPRQVDATTYTILITNIGPK